MRTVHHKGATVQKQEPWVETPRGREAFLVVLALPSSQEKNAIHFYILPTRLLSITSSHIYRKQRHSFHPVCLSIET